MKKTLLLSAASLIFLASCQKDDNPIGSASSNKISNTKANLAAEAQVLTIEKNNGILGYPGVVEAGEDGSLYIVNGEGILKRSVDGKYKMLFANRQDYNVSELKLGKGDVLYYTAQNLGSYEIVKLSPDCKPIILYKRRATAIAIDKNESVYALDDDSRELIKISDNGKISVIATKVPELLDMLVAPDGNIYGITSTKVIKITPQGMVTVVAGGDDYGYADGVGTTARFERIGGITVNKAGDFFVAETGNERVRKITPDGVVSTLAGRGDVAGLPSQDGPGSQATFSDLQDITIDKNDVLYTVQWHEARIAKITY